MVYDVTVPPRHDTPYTQLEGSMIGYHPASGYAGTDSFGYQAGDGEFSLTVTHTVHGLAAR